METLFELADMAGMADFYCARPVLSSTLTGNLIGSLMFSRVSHDDNNISMVANALPLVFLAWKIRHAVLIKECIILLWSGNTDDLPDEIHATWWRKSRNHRRK